MSTSATIASTIGTALKPAQGSCRPFVATSLAAPLISMVFAGIRRLLVGLNAILRRRSCPSERAQVLIFRSSKFSTVLAWGSKKEWPRWRPIEDITVDQ